MKPRKSKPARELESTTTGEIANRDFEITSSRDQELNVKCRGNAKGLRTKKPFVSSSCHHGILRE